MLIKFTDMYLKNLKPKISEYTVREKGGFGVRVMPTGRKVFFYQYRIDGQRRFLNLGVYPDLELKDARKKYEAAASQVNLLKSGLPGGADPVQVKTDKSVEREEHRKAHTVAELITEYIEKHAMIYKKGWQEDKRILEKDALPIWGKRKAADISKRDVVLLLEKIMERGSPGSANGNFKCIRKMFSFAVERDILAHSPCVGVKMPAPINSRERTLSEAEIKTLWASLEVASISDEIKRAIKLIFVTAQRPGEVIGMHTNEIDDKWWTIPAERAKNGKTHRVFLTDTALELIGSLKKTDKETGKEVDRGNIFPCPHEKKKQPIAVNALAHSIRRNLAWPVLIKGKQVYDNNGKPVTENRLGTEAFTPHDGRRTAATFMAQMGFMDEIIDAVLNHVKQGIIKTYNRHDYDKEKQQALEAWERKLKSIITGTESKVIPIKRKTA